MFHEILYRPLFNALVFLYKTIALNDLGLAIIFLTLIIRFILYPLFYKSYRNQTLLQKIQPDIKKIQHTHKGNRERQAQELLSLYKQHKVNPFSSFVLLLVQLPILIALYQVFRIGISNQSLTDLYAFIPKPPLINNVFLGLIDLAKPNIIIVGLAAVAQYFQARLSAPKLLKNQDLSPSERMGRQMAFIGPVLTLFILYSLPAAIGIYWLTTSVFSVIQQLLVNRSLNKEIIIHGELPNQNQNTT